MMENCRNAWRFCFATIWHRDTISRRHLVAYGIERTAMPSLNIITGATLWKDFSPYAGLYEIIVFELDGTFFLYVKSVFSSAATEDNLTSMPSIMQPLINRINDDFDIVIHYAIAETRLAPPRRQPMLTEYDVTSTINSASYASSSCHGLPSIKINLESALAAHPFNKVYHYECNSTSIAQITAYSV